MGAGDVRQLGAKLAKIKAQFDERNRDGLICKQGFYKGCSVLKLQRRLGRMTRWIGCKTNQESFFCMDERSVS